MARHTIWVIWHVHQARPVDRQFPLAAYMVRETAIAIADSLTNAAADGSFFEVRSLPLECPDTVKLEAANG